MLIHLLGLLDALAAVVLFLGHYDLVGIPLLYAAIYLATKIFFFRDFLSLMDLLAALYAVYLYFSADGSTLTWLFLGFFAYKTSIWLFYSFAD